MKKFVAELFKGPDGIRGDEVSLLAFMIGAIGAILLFEFAVLEAFSVLFLKTAFRTLEFANGAARLFGSITAGLSAVAAAMGLKARLGG